MNEEINLNDEWQRVNHLPDDDYDEEEELDARIEKAEKRRKNHINRGQFFGI